MDSLPVARSMRGSIGMLAMHWLMSSSAVDVAVAAGMPARANMTKVIQGIKAAAEAEAADAAVANRTGGTTRPPLS